MSVTESIFNTARDLLTMSANIKRMETTIDKLTEENRSLDRRLMKIEVMIDLVKQPSARKRTLKELA